jgi:glycosyltransferase involved in cell wall biosynthesis
MTLRMLFPFPCDNDLASHPPFSLARHLSETDLKAELWVTRRGPRARAAFVRTALPGAVSSVIDRANRTLQPGSSWSGSLLERRYAAAFREGDVAHVYRGCSLRLMRSLRARGHVVFMERINTMARTTKHIIDDAFARAGWPPDHSHDGRTTLTPRQEEAVLAQDQAATEAADFVFSSSPAVTASLQECGIPGERILRCTLGWDPARFQGTGRALAAIAGVTILSVGRIGVRKGGHLLLQAWSRAGIAGRLVLAGRMDAAIATHCASHFARPDVIHLDYHPDPGPVYRSADIFAFPTLEEGSPLVVYEAMGAGLPTVTSPMGAGDVIRHGIEGLIVDPHDEGQLIAALRALAADPERRRAMGEAGRLRAAEYTWDRVARRRYDLIKGAMAERGA